jgi:hypothetical protein
VLLVGVDTEWRDPRPQCAVVQVALSDQVFVIDTYRPLVVDRDGAFPLAARACLGTRAGWTGHAACCHAEGHQASLAEALNWVFALPSQYPRVRLLGFGFHGDASHLTTLGVDSEVWYGR